jgi:WD40 repeat protein
MTEFVLSRRRFAAAVLGSVAVGLTSGACGGSGTAPSAGAPPATSPAAAPAGGRLTPGEISGILYGGDGRTVFVGDDTGHVSALDGSARTVLRSREVDYYPFGTFSSDVDLAVSPDGRFLAVAARKLEVWNAADLTTTATLWTPDQGPADPVPPSWLTDSPSLQFSNAAAVSPDSSVIADGLYGGAVRLWDHGTGKQVAELREGVGIGSVESLAFAPDGSRIAASFSAPISGGGKGAVAVWDVASRKQLFTVGVATGNILFRRDGGLCASTESGVVVLDATGAKVGKPLADTPRMMAISKDGKLLALGGGSDDRLVQLWDPDKLTLLHSFRAADSVRALAFDPASSAIAVGDGSGGVEVRPVG